MAGTSRLFAFEDSLRQLPGVIAASVISKSDGFVQAPARVHVIASRGSDAHQLKVDIAQRVRVDHGIDLDHGIVTVSISGFDHHEAPAVRATRPDPGLLNLL